jgi:Ca-activated chloride channel family protein
MELLITSFDTGIYYIPPQPVVFRDESYSDTLYSRPTYLEVLGVKIDTTNTVRDIKGPEAVPVTFLEIVTYVLPVLLVAILVYLVVLYFIRRKKKKPLFKPARPEEPADITALRELDKIKAQKLWQQNKVKENYKGAMKEFVFAYPKLLFLLLLIIPLAVYYYFKHSSVSTVQISSVKGFEGLSSSWKVWLRHVLFGLKLIALALLVIVLARPQSSNNWENISTQGIDIVIALDISGSMLAQDFKPDRLEASKEVAEEFIAGRPDDRIGLVVFSGESFTQCPLTTDHSVLINLFKDVKSGMVEDGTAIGVGLANAVTRLKDSEAISKVIILLTDGVNNRGPVDPITAAEIAKTFGIRVYTIGVGSRGKALSPVGIYPNGQYAWDYVDVEIDEETLQQIADITDGKYFRATDNNKLRQIYYEIDQLEKSKINVKEFSRKEEEYFPFAMIAFILLLAEFLIRKTVLRSIQ